MKPRRIALAIDFLHPFRHHFSVVDGIQRYAQEQENWTCSIDPYVQLTEEDSETTEYDGVIARATPGLLTRARKLGIPVVNVHSEAMNEPVHSVITNYPKTGRLAAEHLLHRGYSHFGFHGWMRHPGSQLARSGFEQTLRDAGCTYDTLLVSSRSDESEELWTKYVKRCKHWIANWKKPIGIFVMHDTLCRYLAQVCMQEGLRIPDDVALIGCGNEPLLCAQPEPSLTSIDQHPEGVGYLAAEHLDRLMNGESLPLEPYVVDLIDVVPRRSTDRYVVEDPLVQRAVSFMVDNSHNGIRVRDVAQHCNVTVRSLERHFSSELGRTVRDEISRLRLERAERLLLASTESIKHIAHACGYSSGNYFQQAFKNAHGISPGDFRRRGRQ